MSPVAASTRPLDIELTVEAFLTRAKTDAGAAAASWDAAMGTASPPIAEALWRMLGARMTPDVGSGLLRSLDGVKLAAELALRQMLRPTIPLLPFAAPHQEHDFYRSVALRYGTPAVRDALRLGRLVLVALRKSSSTLAGTGKGSYDDRIAVLRGVGRAVERALSPPAPSRVRNIRSALLSAQAARRRTRAMRMSAIARPTASTSTRTASRTRAGWSKGPIAIMRSRGASWAIAPFR